MHKYFAILIMLSACSSCVSVINDHTVGDYEPAKVSLHDYNGTYKEEAVYSTPPNMMGLMGDSTLGGVLRGHKFGGDVNVRVTKSREIIITCNKVDSYYRPIRYAEGKDFKFVDHTIVFARDRDVGTNDSPVIGYASSKVKWLLDKKGRLVNIKEAGGAGLLTVIPMAAWGKTVAIFERKK